MIPTIDNWQAIAQQYCRNEQYYRSLLVQIGKIIGNEAFLANDGSQSGGVVVARLPELIKEFILPRTGKETIALNVNFHISEVRSVGREYIPTPKLEKMKAIVRIEFHKGPPLVLELDQHQAELIYREALAKYNRYHMVAT